MVGLEVRRASHRQLSRLDLREVGLLFHLYHYTIHLEVRLLPWNRSTFDGRLEHRQIPIRCEEYILRSIACLLAMQRPPTSCRISTTTLQYQFIRTAAFWWSTYTHTLSDVATRTFSRTFYIRLLLQISTSRCRERMLS